MDGFTLKSWKECVHYHKQIFANNLLTKLLSNHGNYQSEQISGLWRHVYRPISIILVVGNFGIDYVVREHADQLTIAIKTHYKKSQQIRKNNCTTVKQWSGIIKNNLNTYQCQDMKKKIAPIWSYKTKNDNISHIKHQKKYIVQMPRKWSR